MKILIVNNQQVSTIFDQVLIKIFPELDGWVNVIIPFCKILYSHNTDRQKNMTRAPNEKLKLLSNTFSNKCRCFCLFQMAR